MVRRMLMVMILLALFIGPASLLAQTDEITVSTTQPTTQTILVQSVPPEVRESIYDDLLKTKLLEIAQGKRALDWRELLTLSFWYDTIKDLIVTLLAFVPRVIGTGIFLVVFWFIYRAIRRVAVGSMKKSEIDSSIRDLLGSMIKWTVMGFGIVIACNQLGIPIVAMLTGVSIIGLAVGFAAQETLANFIAGIVIFIDKPFKVGDWIEVGDQQGSVRRITFRSTRFVNLDGDVVVLPNIKILSEQIINKSTNSVTRVNVPMSIAYKHSIDAAREVLLATLKGDPRIEAQPQAEVVVRACGASSVDLMLHFWIREERYEDAMVWEYLERCKKALDAAGIEIPFPHVQLLVESTPAIAALAGHRRDAA